MRIGVIFLLKKLSVILVLLVLVSGCTAKKPDIKAIMNVAFKRPIPAGTNHNKSYFRYYLSPSTGLIESTQISSILLIEKTKIVLQLNVADIVERQYYSEEILRPHIILPDASPYQLLEGSYYDRNNQEQYFVLAYKIMDNDSALVLKNQYVTLITVAANSAVDIVLESMFMIMRGVEVDSPKVVATFSNKEIIDYQSIEESFFELAVPESGSLIDMYNRLHPDKPLSESVE